ncbi:hypothetical protein Bbelb_427820 [Branchiostoma belcheri]|nr:hypothetical protein Bbelb_427820 [Branchiostoma belcheri]
MCLQPYKTQSIERYHAVREEAGPREMAQRPQAPRVLQPRPPPPAQQPAPGVVQPQPDNGARVDQNQLASCAENQDSLKLNEIRWVDLEGRPTSTTGPLPHLACQTTSTHIPDLGRHGLKLGSDTHISQAFTADIL